MRSGCKRYIVKKQIHLKSAKTEERFSTQLKAQLARVEELHELYNRNSNQHRGISHMRDEFSRSPGAFFCFLPL